MSRITKAAAEIYGWDCPLRTLSIRVLIVAHMVRALAPLAEVQGLQALPGEPIPDPRGAVRGGGDGQARVAHDQRQLDPRLVGSSYDWDWKTGPGGFTQKHIVPPFSCKTGAESRTWWLQWLYSVMSIIGARPLDLIFLGILRWS